MYKYVLNFENFSSEVYVTPQPNNMMGPSEMLQTIRGYVSKFKTECIITGKPYNIPHFINWMNKYTHYTITRDIPTSGRIDF